MKTKVIYLSPDCEYYVGEFEALTNEEKLHVAKNTNEIFIYSLEDFQKAFNGEFISNQGFIYFI